MNAHTTELDRAAAAVASADAILIGAGAGMGVDSGLPDFRGNKGFWKAYPPLAKLGHSFIDMANPRWFERDPQLAWGFYGHRLNLYRKTRPHRGFELLRTWGARARHGAFVFTSNVDGQFQRAGFDEDQVVECHGSIHHLQCTRPCSDAVWSAADEDVVIEMKTLRARAPLPRCERCRDLARPNILMFGDWSWDGARSGQQEVGLQHWLGEIPRDRRVVVIECGAGTAIPSVRRMCERIASRQNGALVRINPRESQGPRGCISLPMGAAAALQGIADRLGAGSG